MPELSKRLMVEKPKHHEWPDPRSAVSTNVLTAIPNMATAANADFTPQAVRLARPISSRASTRISASEGIASLTDSMRAVKAISISYAQAGCPVRRARSVT